MTAQDETAAREQPPARYAISEDAAAKTGRCLPLLAYSRQCWICQQEMEAAESIALPLSGFMDNIADCCAEKTDYLLPDTPMKEAVFRVLLARRNEPVTADEISEDLSRRWSMTQFPRPTSPRVMRRLLSAVRAYYCIEAVEG